MMAKLLGIRLFCLEINVAICTNTNELRLLHEAKETLVKEGKILYDSSFKQPNPQKQETATGSCQQIVLSYLLRTDCRKPAICSGHRRMVLYYTLVHFILSVLDNRKHKYDQAGYVEKIIKSVKILKY